MEADLDLGDKLRSTDKELSGERLIDIQYTSQKPMSFNNISYSSSANDHRSSMEPVLHRPTTPGQLRQSNTAHRVDSLANNLAVNSNSDGFDNQIRQAEQEKQTHSDNHERSKSNSSESIDSSPSLAFDLNPDS
jgi:hypothetical protein